MCSARAAEQAMDANANPVEGSKVPEYGVCSVSTLGILIIVLGRCLVFGYLDP